jgi:hypothetical protein
MPKGKKNIYTCEECGGETVTIDIDEGVTPFMLGCRVNGKFLDVKGQQLFAPGCRGMAQSEFYSQRAQDRTPEWEWFKPSIYELRKLTPAMKDHVLNGGLDIRSILKVRHPEATP